VEENYWENLPVLCMVLIASSECFLMELVALIADTTLQKSTSVACFHQFLRANQHELAC
jgi:hypothetical protein